MEYTAPSWKQLHKMVFSLSQKIENDTYKPDLIVAIARGGLTISHILSDFLRLPITTFTISTYKDLKQERSPKIELHLGNKLHNRNILLVDDVSDTGKTFIRGIEYLKELGASDIKTASVFLKPWAQFTPDYWVKKTDAWIVFPFDVRETIEALRNKKDSKTLLHNLKIPTFIK